jgi:hypothetical protein
MSVESLLGPIGQGLQRRLSRFVLAAAALACVKGVSSGAVGTPAATIGCVVVVLGFCASGGLVWGSDVRDRGWFGLGS